MPRKKKIKEILEDVEKAHRIYRTPDGGMSTKRYQRLSKKHGWTSISTINRRLGGLNTVKAMLGIRKGTRRKALTNMTDREYMCANCPVMTRIYCDKDEEKIEKCYELAKKNNYFEGRYDD